MLLLLSLYLQAESPIHGQFELRSPPHPFRLVLHSSPPASRVRRVQLTVRSMKANGRPTRATFVPEGQGPLQMPAGAREAAFRLVLRPPLSNTWIDGELTVSSVGSRHLSPIGVYAYLPPVGRAADQELARARNRYLGKQVWIYGGSVGAESLQEDEVLFVGLRPMKVIRVTRRRPVGTRWSGRSPSFLVAEFAPTPDGEISFRDEQRRVIPAGSASAKGLHRPYVAAPSSLMLSESISLKPPSNSRQRGTASMERAMRNFDVEFGRTKQEVLWTLGPPSVHRPWRSVFGQPKWVYGVAAPFSHVLTFRSGRVHDRRMDGDLP